MTTISTRRKLKRNGVSYYAPPEQMTPEYINSNFPIIGIDKYATTLVVVRGSKLPPRLMSCKENKRGKIKELSRKSLSRLAFLTRENGKMFKSLLTLTYGNISPKDGRELKIHLNRVLTYLRRAHKAQYVWFLEFTRAGRPHIHVLLDHPPSIIDRFALAEYWANGVAINWPTEVKISFLEQVNTRNKMFSVHFHKASWEIIRKPGGAARYVTKYATKLKQKQVPPHFEDVGRFWGASKEVSLGDPEYSVDVTEEDLRAWLSDTMSRDLSHFDVLPKYVYLFGDDQEANKDGSDKANKK